MEEILINENKTIEVIFDVKTYVVEVIVQGNGRASVEGVQMVEHGESLTVKFTPYVGYKVSQILVNGRALSGAELNNAIANGYTFKTVKLPVSSTDVYTGDNLDSAAKSLGDQAVNGNGVYVIYNSTEQNVNIIANEKSSFKNGSFNCNTR